MKSPLTTTLSLLFSTFVLALQSAVAVHAANQAVVETNAAAKNAAIREARFGRTDPQNATISKAQTQFAVCNARGHFPRVIFIGTPDAICFALAEVEVAGVLSDQ